MFKSQLLYSKESNVPITQLITCLLYFYVVLISIIMVGPFQCKLCSIPQYSISHDTVTKVSYSMLDSSD